MHTAYTQNIILFYDHPCVDGAASVWVAHNALKENPSLHLKYVPIGYGKPEERTQKVLSHLVEDAEIFFLDTSPKNDTLALLFNPPESLPKIKKLTIIDHHASEVDRVKKFQGSLKRDASLPAETPELNLILDADKPAAALLTWEHFHPTEQAPKLLEWVGLMEPPVRLKTNRDFAIAAFIDSKDISTPENIFSSIGSLIDLSEKEMVTRGNSILADQFNNINKSIKTSLLYTKLELLPNWNEWIPLVNANVQNFGRLVNVTMVQEACAEAMCGISGAWFVQGDGTVKLSLRSKGTPDVGKVAQHLSETIGIGGGGHATDAVVQFENLMQFSQNVPLCTKDQMLAQRTAPQPTVPEMKKLAQPEKTEPK